MLCATGALPGFGPHALGKQPPRSARFANAPVEARILKIIHSWPDNSVQQDQLIRSLSAQGFGGVVCNVSFTDYLENEEKWNAFTRAVRAAKQAGMALWLYDEKGYPSGNAGGLVLRNHPEWEARGLLVADAECGDGSVTLEVPPGRSVLSAAFPVQDGLIQLDKRVDLAQKIREGKLTWDAPPGQWRVMAITENRLFEGTHATMNLWQQLPYPNLLMAEPTALFLQFTHERYAQHLGTDLGKSFVATFTDEPSLMSMFLKRMPYRPLPWSSRLAAEFQRRRGYALEPIVPELVAESGPAGQKHRYDFWQTVGELVSENFFGQIQDCCHRHRILSGGHLLAEEGIVAHVPLYGDFFRCVRRLDAPSIDCLTSLPPEVPWYIGRLANSAAELEGKQVVMCETSDHGQVYRPPGDQRPKRTVTETEIRGTCNRLMVSGVNCITSYYSFTDLSNDQLRRLNEWVGRCCTMLQGGHQVADIAVLYPIESIWPKFVPAHLWANESPKASWIENVYRTALDDMFAARRDVTIVDSRALAEARIEQGALIHGKLRWRVMVLPGADTLPLVAWKNLERFVAKGGVVIALGARPANSETELPSAQVQALAREIFGEAKSEPSAHVNRKGGAGVFLPSGSEALLPLVLDGILEPDVKVADRRAPLRTTHRRIDGHEVYFLINDSDRPWDGDVELCTSGTGEQWDPATGKQDTLSNPTLHHLTLDPYAATLLRFPSARLPRRSGVKPGALPNLVLRSLPEVQPIVSRGEFVREQLSPEASSARQVPRSWQANATLTKEQVDTFLFVRFAYPRLLDLSRADCLEIETWVPPGQRTPTQLLVILQEKNGGDFLASTPRSLGAPGRDRTFLPLNRFQLAGWSKDNDGVLDLTRISEIRIGWGGYFGNEGERVEFRLVAPRAGSAAGR